LQNFNLFQFVFQFVPGQLFHEENSDDPDSCYGFQAKTPEDCPQYPGPYIPTDDEPIPWPDTYDYSAKPFPDDFVWGLGTAAYQVEGAYNEDGRGATIWDTYTGANTRGMAGANATNCPEDESQPCLINNWMTNRQTWPPLDEPQPEIQGNTGNVAINQYNDLDNHIGLMAKMNLPTYRFSLAWSRICPTGDCNEGVNQAGIDHYNHEIDLLLANNINPIVTLYHWDLPQGLMNDGEMGWYAREEDNKTPAGVNAKTVQAYLDYAKIVFENFADRVTIFSTMNEPLTFCAYGNGQGSMAPGLPEMEGDENFTQSWKFTCGHNILIAHGLAVKYYRENYTNGQIGIVGNTGWVEPYSTSNADVAAAKRAMDSSIGWFAEPIYKGDYPISMRVMWGDVLPKFTDEELELVKGSNDYFGFNHYGTGFTMNDASEDGTAANKYTKGGTPDGVTSIIQSPGSFWLTSGAWGFRKLLNYIKNEYEPAGGIYLLENGWSMPLDGDSKNDEQRVMYYGNYTASMRLAIDEDDVDVRSYIGWSFSDNFEWLAGYGERFGVVFADYNFGKDENAPVDNEYQPRAPVKLTRKDSSCLLQAIWSGNVMVDPSGFTCEEDQYDEYDQVVEENGGDVVPDEDDQDENEDGEKDDDEKDEDEDQNQDQENDEDEENDEEEEKDDEIIPDENDENQDDEIIPDENQDDEVIPDENDEQNDEDQQQKGRDRRGRDGEGQKPDDCEGLKGCDGHGEKPHDDDDCQGQRGCDGHGQKPHDDEDDDDCEGLKGCDGHGQKPHDDDENDCQGQRGCDGHGEKPHDDDDDCEGLKGCDGHGQKPHDDEGQGRQGKGQGRGGQGQGQGGRGQGQGGQGQGRDHQGQGRDGQGQGGKGRDGQGQGQGGRGQGQGGQGQGRDGQGQGRGQGGQGRGQGGQGRGGQGQGQGRGQGGRGQGGRGGRGQ